MRVGPAGAIGLPVELVRWPGAYAGHGGYGGGRIALLHGTAGYQLALGRRSAHGFVLGLAPIDLRGSQARRLAGWLDERRVVAAAAGDGGHDVVAVAVDGTVTTLVGGPGDDLPDTVVDGAVLYHRAVGATTELWRHGPDGERRLAEVTSAAAAANLVRCAGDRTRPCVLEELRGSALHYLLIDPGTGARGPEVYRAPLTGRFLRSHALSPDGQTLAVVDGASAVTTVAVATGATTRHELRPGAEAQSIAWAADGASLLVTAFSGGDELFNLIRLGLDGRRRTAASSNYRWFWRAHEAPTGDAVAVQARDLELDIWLVEGLAP